jgi:uncharacterized protein YjbJ (UPF0337 family)
MPRAPQIGNMSYIMDDNNNEETKRSLRDKITGMGQKIIGEIEEVGGALTGDPMTQAEGEFNVEVGEIREELEESNIDDKQ